MTKIYSALSLLYQTKKPILSFRNHLLSIHQNIIYVTCLLILEIEDPIGTGINNIRIRHQLTITHRRWRSSWLIWTYPRLLKSNKRNHGRLRFTESARFEVYKTVIERSAIVVCRNLGRPNLFKLREGVMEGLVIDTFRKTFDKHLPGTVAARWRIAHAPHEPKRETKGFDQQK